jgi:glucose-6-phosphate 1-dehydrogenase
VATLLVLGASGDLASRLLLPGLAELLASGRAASAPGGLQLVGAGVEDLGGAQWRERVARAFGGAADRAAPGAGGDVLEAVLDGTRYQRVDVTDDAELAALLAGCPPPVAVCFALPPAVTAAACAALERTGVPAGTRLVLEKPFGSDEASARELNALVGRLVPERQVHRVDHFLGRSTVLNLLGLRFANRIFEPLLSSAHVERVDLVYDEDLALEGRARYYDRAGALVDMVQSHLLLVMALLAMDAPATLDERDLRDRQGELLRAVRLAGPPDVASRRARYTAGRVGEREVVDYAAEAGVDPALGTETLAEVDLVVDTWRWAGVPFRLRSGKALGRPRKEAVITFRPVPHLPRGLLGQPAPSRLRLGFSPDSVTLDLTVNSPGDPFTLDATRLSSRMGASDLPAYGQVLAGVLAGDPTLSVRADVVEACWRVVAPVLAAWRAGEVPLEEYPAGGDGPPPREPAPGVRAVTSG